MLRIQDLRVKSEEQVNPRLRVVYCVSYVFPAKSLRRMSQRCYSVVSPWCTKARTTDEAHQANCALFLIPRVGHTRVRSMGSNLGGPN